MPDGCLPDARDDDRPRAGAHHPDLRIIVCGRGDRGDDGAALLAMARLLPTLSRESCGRIEIRRTAHLGAPDLIDLGDGEACLILDTVTGVPPGEVIVVAIDRLNDPGSTIESRSAHGVPLGEAITIAAAARGGTPPGSLVGIGGKWFGYGDRTSRTLRSALPAYVDAIRLELARQLEARPVGRDGAGGQPTGAAGAGLPAAGGRTAPADRAARPSRPRGPGRTLSP